MVLFSSIIYPGVELLSYLILSFFWEAKLFLVFWETSILFSMVARWFIFHQQCRRVSFFHILANIFFFKIDIWHVRWYLIVVLHCISLMISQIELLFMCCLVICISSWISVFSILLPNFLRKSFVCLMILSYMSCLYIIVIQLLSYVHSCDPMDCSTPGFPVLHSLPEFAEIHVHWASDAIQPSHPPSPPSPPALKSFPAATSLPVSRFFTSGGQILGGSASSSVLPMNIKSRLPLELTGYIFGY